MTGRNPLGLPSQAISLTPPNCKHQNTFKELDTAKINKYYSQLIN